MYYDNIELTNTHLGKSAKSEGIVKKTSKTYLMSIKTERFLQNNPAIAFEDIFKAFQNKMNELSKAPRRWENS